MDIFEFGMQMERDGEAYYRDLAAKTRDKGLANIFTMLADSEVNHYNVLKDMARKTDPRLTETHLLSDVKNLFAAMGAEDAVRAGEDAPIEQYQKALELERQSEAFYREKGAAATKTIQQDLFEILAEEEKQHGLILENIIEFVSGPQSWLENAEWNPREPY